MQGHIASFSSPVKWLREGFHAIRLAPFGMVSICIFYAFTMSVLGALPMLGLVIAAFFMPFGTMLVIDGTRQAFEATASLWYFDRPIQGSRQTFTLDASGCRLRALFTDCQLLIHFHGS